MRAGPTLTEAPSSPPAGQLWASLAEACRQAWIPLPAEAIGLGARWVATGPMSRGGIFLRRRTRVRLVRKGPTIELEGELTEVPFGGIHGDPSIVEGFTLEVARGDGVGRTRLSSSPGSAFVRSLETQTATDLVVRSRPSDPSPAAPREQDLLTKTTQVITIEALDAPTGAGKNGR